MKKKDKLSDCEKSFFPKDDGTIGCKCARRADPPKFEESFYRAAFKRILSEMKKTKEKNTEISDLLAKFLKLRFKSSSMNICQTQPLPMMHVPPMTVEMKDSKFTKAKKTSRVIAAPLALREQTKKILIAQ